MTLSRRHFIRGAGLILAAPAIVRASSLMPVKAAANTQQLVLCSESYVGGYIDPRWTALLAEDESWLRKSLTSLRAVVGDQFHGVITS